MSTENTPNTPETVYGWNTWASNPPKDYLAKFAAAGINGAQVVIIDDILPQIIKGRDVESQARQTQLYKLFFTQLQQAMRLNNFQVHVLSDLATANDLFQVAGKLTFSDAVSSMPMQKRDNYKDLNLTEIWHPIAEIFAYLLMAKFGATRIIRGSGQVGLVNIAKQCLPEEVSFEFVDADADAMTLVKERVSPSSLRRIEHMIQLWADAGLLSGHTQIDKAEDFTRYLPEKYRVPVLKLKEFYELTKSTLAVTGSTVSETLDPDKSDLDIIVLSDEIMIPPFFSSLVPDDVKIRYAKGSIPTASIKANLEGISTSIKFIRPQFAFKYWSDQAEFTYWREYPESAAAGKDRHEYLDSKGNPYTFFFKEVPFKNKGTIYRQKRFTDRGVPLIDHNAHMLLTMQMVVDNLCLSEIKLELITKLLQYASPGSICNLLNYRKRISQKLSQEIEATIKISEFLKNPQLEE